MDPTTLVTFLFRAPPEVRTVELLGSWDNFARPYYMHHDRRRGRGFWSGCFQFKNIIFDGDRTGWTKPRSGGLKQGGTYWYFYRLNDEMEAFDDTKEFTTGCPLLPGQALNVIDVPTEIDDPPSRRRSATTDVFGTLTNAQRAHTWNPDDKWAALAPPPVSKVHERCISDLALNGRLETKPQSLREATASSISQSCSKSLPSANVEQQKSVDEIRPMCHPESAPPSRADSSIFNASVVNGGSRNEQSNFAFPVPDAYHVDNRPCTRDGSRAHHSFEFAFDDASPRRSVSRTGDHDLDDSSFIYESDDSPSPSTYGSVDGRFRVASADSEHDVYWDSQPYAEHARDSDGDVVGGDNGDARRESHQSHVDTDGTVLDVCSPTFSAATISSNGGVDTPFRLSAGFTGSTAPPSVHAATSAPDNNDDDRNDPAIEHITARLHQLGSEDSADSLPSQLSSAATATSDDGHHHHHPRVVVGHYALPLHATESVTTLGKLSSSGRASIAHDPPPPLPSGFRPPPGDGAAFADPIFDELGYLGGSIA